MFDDICTKHNLGPKFNELSGCRAGKICTKRIDLTHFFYLIDT